MRKPVLLVALLLVLLLTGCSGSGADSGTSSGGGTSGLPEPAQVPGAGRGSEDAGGDTGSVPLERSVIRSGSLSVSVPDVGDARREALEVVRRSDGRLESESASGTPEGAAAGEGEDTAQLTFRVPPDELDPLLEDLSGLGRLVSRESSSVDVTEDVADVESRVRSLQTSIDRLRTLLSQTGDVSELVAVESELTTREAELESLQARQRALSEQVDEATLTLYLYQQGSPLEEDESGFLPGLSEGWDAFTSAVVVGLTVLGALTPFLVALGVVALLAWFAVRASRRRRPVPDVPGPAPRKGSGPDVQQS